MSIPIPMNGTYGNSPPVDVGQKYDYIIPYDDAVTLCTPGSFLPQNHIPYTPDSWTRRISTPL